MGKQTAKDAYLNERRQKIKDELDAKRLPCAVGILDSKFIENVGGIIRTCNALLMQEIVMDSNIYSRGATVGSDKWENINIQVDVLKYLKEAGYTLVALEQTENSILVWDFEFPEKVAIIPGHETQGNSDETVALCDYCVEIPQYGLVESLNVSTATSIALYEYSRQHRRK